MTSLALRGRRHCWWEKKVAIKGYLAVATATMSRREPPSTNPSATSLTPPSTQEAVAMDAPMKEASPVESASTTAHQSAPTAGRPSQIQPQEQQQQQHQQHYSAPERAPLVSGAPSGSIFSREHPPRAPTPRQSTARQFDNTSPDRKRPHPSSYPSALESLPQIPHLGMSAPLAPRARTDTPADRVPHFSSYPTAPASAAQTPRSMRSQTPQQGVSAAGWLASPPSHSSSRITFDGMFEIFLPLYPVPFSCLLLLLREKMKQKKARKGRV